MAEPSQHDFGDVDELDVESIGEPGQRTFRFLAEVGSRTASLWVEKEQLQAFALIVDQQIARLSRRKAVGERALLTLAGRFPARASVDFKAGRMAVGYDEGLGKFVLSANDVEGAAAFTCRATLRQVQAVSAKVVEVVAAGRPRCPLCGAPMEGKHVCPASNGHAR